MGQDDPEETLVLTCSQCGNRFTDISVRSDGEIICAGCTVVAPEKDSSRSSRHRIGKYTITNLLGRGGMGMVFQAWDETLQRSIALKILDREEDVEGLRLRFQREARTAASLDHPGIVRVYEVARADGKDFIAQEFIDGKTLSQVDLPLRVSVEAIAEVAEAVSFAHENGVIHRDLKPQNIMIDKKGKARVMDFGLAKQTEGGDTLTMEGSIMGTPAYMSPEQAEGKGVGPRSDLYSLGALLYKTLCGHPPFLGETPLETLQKLAKEEVVPPSRRASNVPRALETIALKCLEKNPNHRYSSAALLAADLRRWSRGEAIEARPLSFLALLWRKVSRSRWGFLPVMGLLLALGIGIFFLVDRASEKARLSREAERAMEKQEWKRAEVLFEKAGEAEGLKRVRAELAAIEKARALAQPKFNAGKAKLDKAILDLYREGIDLSARTQQLGRAIMDFSAAVKLYPRFGEAYFQRGLCWIELRDFANARDDFSRAIEWRPSIPNAFYGRGLANFWLTIELRMSPRATPEMIQRGMMAQEQSARDFEVYKSMRGTDPEKVGLSMLFVEFIEGKFDEAFSLSSKMIQGGISHELIYFLHGLILSGQSSQGKSVDFKEMEKAYSESIRRQVNFLDGYRTRSEFYINSGKYKKAISDLKRAIEINPDVPGLKGNMGSCYLRLEMWEEAEKILRELITDGPAHPTDLVNLGYLCSKTGRNPEAVRYVGRAIELEPENAAFLATRGSIFQEMGLLEDALEDFTEATIVAPGDPYAYQLRGGLYYTQEIWANAAADFSAFLKRYKKQDLDFMDTLLGLGVCYFKLEHYSESLLCWEQLQKLGYKPEVVKEFVRKTKMHLEK